MPVGIATANDVIMKKPSTPVGSGATNMWCAHTITPRNAIAPVAAAIAL